jgi:hypothetical protein
MRSLSAIFALAVGILIFASPTANASIISAQDYEVIESVGSNGNGHYTVINHSDDEYIYAFSVTNPLAPKVNDWTTEKGWTSGKTPLLGGPKDGFWYGTLPGVWTVSHRHPEFLINPQTIGPGEHSSNFFFGTDQLASTVTLFLVDDDGRFSTTTFTAAVPEASTWAMMVLGFIGLGLMARHRRRTAAVA